MLEINDIICPAPDASTVIEGISRFVRCDNQHNAYLIRMDNDPLTAPFKVSMHELRSAIMTGEILLDQQFEIDIAPTAEVLSAAAAKQMRSAVNMLAPILEDDNILFDRDYRGRMFNELASSYGVHPRLIRRHYYLYLWGGKTELALAPYYVNRGGAGKPQKPGSKRRGPKAKDQTTASLVPLPDLRANLVKGAKLFFLPGNRTLEEAFMDTKKKYFNNGSRIERGGKVCEILLPPEKLPSIGQFRYICEELCKDQNVRKVARRIRQKTAEWDFRGRSRDGVPGPGFRFEIDSTKIQVKLVSRYNRAKVLKNATLYVVVDIWSGAIVGYALSLQNASWALAARALHNCFTDKQEVFDRLELDYTSEEWSCHHLPTRLGADRGELVSDKAGLVPELGIVVEIMPPMCPERKGKVESSIKNIKHGHSHRLPGRHAKYLQRRESDGTDSAALTIDELEKIIVEIIMGLNHDPAPISYIPPEMIEEGETDVTHIGLYRWGLKHYFGHTRKLTSTQVYTNLMLKGVAALTSRGLYFKSQTFVSRAATNPIVKKRNTGKGGFLVDIRYDEHRADSIWFFDRNTNVWVEAINVDENVQRRKAGFYELEIFRDEVKKLRRAAKDENLHRQGEKDKEIKKQVKQAEIEAKEDKKGVSKSARKKNRRENTQFEIETGKMIADGATTQAPTKGAERQPRALIKDNDNEAGGTPLIVQPPLQDQACSSSSPKVTIADISQQLWEELQ